MVDIMIAQGDMIEPGLVSMRRTLNGIMEITDRPRVTFDEEFSDQEVPVRAGKSSRV